MQTTQRQQAARPPIDRLIRLLAEIEVARYMEETREREQSEKHAEDTGGDLRTL